MTKRFLYLCACSFVLPALIILSIGIGLKAHARMFPKIKNMSHEELVRRVLE